MDIIVPFPVDVLVLFARAKSLNEEYTPNIKSTIKCLKDEFDIREGERFLLNNADMILQQCENQTADRILDTICENIYNILKRTYTPGNMNHLNITAVWRNATICSKITFSHSRMIVHYMILNHPTRCTKKKEMK